MNSNTVENYPANEFPSSHPSISIDGDDIPYLTVLSVERSMGINPGKAIIRIGASGIDISGPLTLNAVEWPFTFGSRVEITDEWGETVHLGQILVRNDQGSNDNIIWTSYDDKVFLGQIPMRGCIVADQNDSSNKLKFIRRMDPHFNPRGYWNCVGAESPIDGSVVPVFLPKADLSLSYQAPDFNVPKKLEVGQIVPWTPRLMLLYLRFCSSLQAGAIPGIVASEWRSLYTCDRLNWDKSSITSLVGTDEATNVDPLDRKLPDLNIRGKKMLAAIQDALTIAGTHDLCLDYTNDGFSEVTFAPIAFSAVNSSGSSTYSIPLQRTGVSQSESAYDFDLMDDATQVLESCLVEGHNVHVETMLTNDPTEPFNASYALIPAWTADQERSFLYALNGGSDAATVTSQALRYARYPIVQGATLAQLPWDDTNWLKADGLSGRPLAFARTKEAYELLQKHYLWVYRGFVLDSATMAADGLFDGANGEYEDIVTYPVLHSMRQALPEQLQFQLNEPTYPGTSISNWLRKKLPVRIRVHQYQIDKWFDAPAPSIKSTGDGILVIEGMSWDANNQPYCLYNGDLSVGPLMPIKDGESPIVADNGALSKSRCKSIVINLAVPMDHRVMGQYELDPGDSVLSKDYRSQLGGPPMGYIDSHESYIEDHQINSDPSPTKNVYIGLETAGTKTPVPLTRIVPPGSEKVFADDAALRRVYQNKTPDRRAMYRMIGIRNEWKPGLWVDSVSIINEKSEVDSDYVIGCAVGSVVHDYQAQSTTIGGFLNATIGASAGRQAAKPLAGLTN